MEKKVLELLADWLSDTVWDQYEMERECGPVTAKTVFNSIIENLPYNEGKEQRELEGIMISSPEAVLIEIQDYLNQYTHDTEEEGDSSSEWRTLVGMALGNEGLADLY